MTGVPDPKATLLDYLQNAREAMLFKLDGLGEHDVRRPLTPTGTNLLGLVKHLAYVELGYFGDTFGRPSGIPAPWDGDDDVDPNADLYCAPDESREQVVGLYRTAWALAADTFEVTPLDAVGRVPWWGDDNEVTLHQILVHMVAETCRHAGHADILREGLDGAIGRFTWDANVATGYDWPAHVARVEEAARQAPGSSPSGAPGPE